MERGIIKDILPYISENRILRVKLKVQLETGEERECILGSTETNAIFPVDYFNRSGKEHVRALLKQLRIQGQRSLKGRQMLVFGEIAQFPSWEMKYIKD